MILRNFMIYELKELKMRDEKQYKITLVQKNAISEKICKTCNTNLFLKPICKEAEPLRIQYSCINGHRGQFRISSGKFEIHPV